MSRTADLHAEVGFRCMFCGGPWQEGACCDERARFLATRTEHPDTHAVRYAPWSGMDADELQEAHYHLGVPRNCHEEAIQEAWWMEYRRQQARK